MVSHHVCCGFTPQKWILTFRWRGANGKESACQWETQEMWLPSLGWKDSPGEGNGNLLQYSHLENSMEREAWQARVLEVTKSQAQLCACTHTKAPLEYLAFDHLFYDLFQKL